MYQVIKRMLPLFQLPGILIEVSQGSYYFELTKNYHFLRLLS